MNDKSVDVRAIESWSVDYIAGVLKVPRERIEPGADFDSLGLDSAIAVGFIMSLEEWLGLELAPELLFEHTNVRSLSSYLEKRLASARSGSADGGQ